MSLEPELLQSLLEPVVALVSPTKRVFAPFLLVAFGLATIVWWRKLRGKVSLLGFLFPRRIWASPSALLDYRLMIARAVLGVLLLAPLYLSAQAVAVQVAAGLGRSLGAGPFPMASRSMVAIAFAIIGFLAEDFARYAVHRAAHGVWPLWELHKVHHSADVLTPFSVYRTHPLESVLMRGGAALAVGVVAGVFAWMFRGRVALWDIAGVSGLTVLWNLTGTNLRHSHVWLSYGRWIEHVFISPAQHQIHHSQNPAQCHKNFGSALAIWDWLGGSLYVTTHKRERLRFGLPEEDSGHGPTVTAAILDPIVSIGRRLVGRVRGRARVGA